MPIQTHTTATTPDNDWDGHMIEVDESFWETYLAAEGQPNFQQVYDQGLAQGLITVIQN